MNFGWALTAPDSCEGLQIAPWDPEILARVDEVLIDIDSVLGFKYSIFSPSEGERELASRTQAGSRLLHLIESLDVGV